LPPLQMTVNRTGPSSIWITANYGSRFQPRAMNGVAVREVMGSGTGRLEQIGNRERALCEREWGINSAHCLGFPCVGPMQGPIKRPDDSRFRQ